MIPKNNETVKVFISRDNSKTGIDSFNLLAGDVSRTYSGATPKTDIAREKYAERGIVAEKCGGNAAGIIKGGLSCYKIC